MAQKPATDSDMLLRFVIVAVTFTFCNRVSPTPFLPFILADDFGASSYWVGIAMAAYPIASMLAMPLVFRYATTSRQIVRAYCISLILMGFGATLMSTIGVVRTVCGPDLALTIVILFRGIQGSTNALFLCINSCIISRFYPDNSAYVFGLVEVAVGAGSQVGRLAGGFLYTFGGLATPFLLSAAALVSTGVAGLYYLGSLDTSMQVAENVNTKRKSSTADWVSMCLIPRVSLGIAAVSGVYLMFGFYDACLPQHLVEHLAPISIGAVGIISSIRSNAYLLTSYAVARMIHAKVVRFETLIACGCANICIGLLLVSPQPVVNGTLETLASFGLSERLLDWSLQILSLIISSAGNAMLFIPSLPIMQRGVKHLGIDMVEKVASVFITFMTLGEAVGPIAGGWMVGRVGFTATTGRLCAVYVLVLLAATMVKSRHAAEELSAKDAENDTSDIEGDGDAEVSVSLPWLRMPTEPQDAFLSTRFPLVRVVPSSAPSTTFRRAYDKAVVGRNRRQVTEPLLRR